MSRSKKHEATGELFPAPPDEAPQPTPGAAKVQARAQRAAQAAPEPPAGSGYAAVALDRPVHHEFTYVVPPEVVARAQPGARVLVPFGPRREVGVVVGFDDSPPADTRRLREVHQVLDEAPALSTELLELTSWIAERYACGWGEALAACLPANLRQERASRRVQVVECVRPEGEAALSELEGRHEKQFRLLRTLLSLEGATPLAPLLKRLGLTSSPAKTLAKKGLCRLDWVEERASELASAGEEPARARPDELTEEQEAALAALQDGLSGAGGTFLLHGVTGSGKTEVYLRLIERALAAGRGAIVVVPEIALTPQTVNWFRGRFGEVAVLHSGMTDAQRARTWVALRRGELRVVVGARSALFAPVERLGVLVVDEEHEPSFKQATTPRYHAREVAVERARLAGAVCVLGSATPALESWRRAKQGKYQLLRMQHRVSGASPPRVRVVDLRQERGMSGEAAPFSRPLLQEVKDTLDRGEQAILFQNRRGFAPILWCALCREALRCHQCDVGLTHHRHLQRIVCHSCCEELPLPKLCPRCKKPGLRPLGAGSQRVEAALARLVPSARVARMDSDTMLRREDYERTLAAFGAGELDVLVGTQMIAKGLDFPRVTLVGVVDADGGLHLPDFRASERTFQLVAQVAGRAGRGGLEGRVLVQTHTPEHPAIQRALKHDYEGFAADEERLRSQLGYPPFGELVRALAEDAQEDRARGAISSACEALKKVLRADEAQVLGPAPAPISKLRGRHRWHLLVKARPDAPALALARKVLVEEARNSRVRLAIDVDPLSMM